MVMNRKPKRTSWLRKGRKFLALVWKKLGTRNKLKIDPGFATLLEDYGSIDPTYRYKAVFDLRETTESTISTEELFELSFESVQFDYESGLLPASAIAAPMVFTEEDGSRVLVMSYVDVESLDWDVLATIHSNILRTFGFYVPVAVTGYLTKSRRKGEDFLERGHHVAFQGLTR
jgi:hypothetical protein